MSFILNDGGREAAGYHGKAGDCVARSIAIASGLPYADVYSDLANGNYQQRASKSTGFRRRPRSANDGIFTSRKWFKDYMLGLGFVWTPTMSIGSGCQVHLAADELPAGRLVLSLSKHYTAMIDGVIHDTFDPRRTVVVTTPGNPVPRIIETRCVYGYWSFPDAL